jgi:hypothetical protein
MNLADFMDLAGEYFKVERENEMFMKQGIRTHEEREVKFKPGTDVRPGDWLVADSGNRFYVHDTDVLVAEGNPFALRAFYRTEAEQEEKTRAPEPSHVYNVHGNVYGSVFGSQGHVVMQQSFTFEELDRQIEECGGDDADALKEMVAEIRRTLEAQDNLSRGKFLEWSELLNRHSWITGPVAQMLMLYAVTGQLG